MFQSQQALLHSNNIHSSTLQTEILAPCARSDCLGSSTDLIPLEMHNPETGCAAHAIVNTRTSCSDFVCDSEDCLTHEFN